MCFFICFSSIFYRYIHTTCTCHAVSNIITLFAPNFDSEYSRAILSLNLHRYLCILRGGEFSLSAIVDFS